MGWVEAMNYLGSRERGKSGSMAGSWIGKAMGSLALQHWLHLGIPERKGDMPVASILN